ncbi:MAG: hypothetical protein V4650_01895 [Pseudomonadota bacterium]
MSLSEFLDSPWKKSHDGYAGAVFGVRPAPEFATSEVVVASLYRACGFEGYTESEVPKAGRDFDKTTKATKSSKDEPGQIKLDTWRTVLHSVLESPKRKNQSSKRFLQLCPVVPDVALYSGSPRLAGSSWNPGALVQRMIVMGCDSRDAAEGLWQRLFDALSISESDDLWARWLNDEFHRRKDNTNQWKKAPLQLHDIDFPDAEKLKLRYPAQQFVRDLDAVIAAKGRMTRRQWISILEAVLRLGSAMHVIWLCSVNGKLWARAKDILNGGSAAPTIEEISESYISGERRYLAYGNAATAFVKQYASDYLVARIGLNLVLWILEDLKIEVPTLRSCVDIRVFFELLVKHRERIVNEKLWARYSNLTESEAKTISCRKGVGSNIEEFINHTLRKRETAADNLRGYDQGYILKKRGQAESGALTVSLGPVAVLALVHSCLKEAAGPRSVRKLCDHIAAYGIDVDLDDVANSELGKNLRMLGLVLDSPDAESGMLLVPPF